MNGYKIFLIMLAVMIVSSVNSADATTLQNFSHYEIILQRRPFGERPPSASELAALNRPVVPVGPSFIDSLRLCAITDGGGSIRVGFVDIKQKPIRSYFLFIGQSEDGIEVVSADYEAESVMLRKDGDERQLVMEGGSGIATVPTSSSVHSGRRTSGRRSRRNSVVPKSTLTKSQYNEERRLGTRSAPVSPRRALRGNTMPDDMPADIRDLAMRKYNMDLIRAGGDLGVPLPIPLTADEDAQLVAEGVLAPME